LGDSIVSKLSKLLLVPAFLLLSAVSNALTVSATDVTITSADVGQSFTVDYNGFINGSTIINGLTASAIYTVSGVTSTSITLTVAMTNTSSSPITGSRISAFGFDTNPNLTSATASGFFSGTVLNSAFPSQFGSIELCVKNGQTNNCSGGGGTGITLGQNGTTTVTVNFSSIGSSGVTLSNFGVRYQSITGSNLTTSAVGRGTTTPPIPEPTSMAVFGLGALIVGAALRKRARA
jgi:hypothetical protein